MNNQKEENSEYMKKDMCPKLNEMTVNSMQANDEIMDSLVSNMMNVEKKSDNNTNVDSSYCKCQVRIRCEPTIPSY